MGERRTGQERGEDRRRQYEQVLRAAIELFAQKGYDETSMRDIAALAGLMGRVEMQVLRLFEGRKGNILVAIIRDAWRNLVPLGERVLADQRNTKEKLLQFYRAILEAIIADGDRGTVLLMQSRHLGEVGRQIPQEGFITFIQLLDTMIEEGQQQGLFRPDLNAQAIRQHLIGCGENALMGLLRHRMLSSYPADYTIDDACSVFEAVLDGLSMGTSSDAP